MTPLRSAIRRAGRQLASIYALELDLDLDVFLLTPESVRDWRPAGGPRTGVLAVESGGELRLGVYVDPRDAADPATILEETSHLVCLVWHARHDLPVSALALELQAEVDQFAWCRLAGRSDPLAHFSGFEWDDWIDDDTRGRYRLAHRAGRRYCERLLERFPCRADTPGLLRELRGFYRASPQAKLRAAR